MYHIMKIISIWVRFAYMPNPFGSIENGEVYNILAEPVLHIATFFVVGLFYDRGSEPALGSLLYLIFYFVHVGIILLIGFFGWTSAGVIIILAVYVFLLGFLKTALENFV